MEKCFFLLDSLGIGGSERKTIRVVNQLAKEGRPVHIGFLSLVSNLRQEIHPDILVFSGNRKGKFDVRLLLRIRRYIRENQIGVTWAVNLYPLLYVYFATLGMGGKVRVVGSSNITVFRSAYERAKMRLYAPIIRRLDAFIFGSYQQKTEWTREYHLPGEGLKVIHNGVDPDWFSCSALDIDRSTAMQLFGFDESDIVVGMVAQFRPEKAHRDLVESCHLLRQRGFPVKLLLVGDGAEKESIRKYAQELCIADCVVFAGQLDDVRPALRAMAIFALTSRAVETFSNAALEAMAMELPVVLSDLSGASEMISSEGNGFLYPPGDVAALTNVLEGLMQAEVRQNCGRIGRKNVEQYFSLSQMSERYSQIIWGG